MQPGDVPVTYANIDEINKEFGFNPKTNISHGIQKFVDWYLEYKSKISFL